ncbi:hypothetical protein HK102_001223 [Quaeritorhiza haematococci]|nr:hypothetical protein HK102_001223 [Quaeritorhiza haematococci]
MSPEVSQNPLDDKMITDSNDSEHHSSSAIPPSANDQQNDIDEELSDPDNDITCYKNMCIININTLLTKLKATPDEKRRFRQRRTIKVEDGVYEDVRMSWIEHGFDITLNINGSKGRIAKAHMIPYYSHAYGEDEEYPVIEIRKWQLKRRDLDSIRQQVFGDFMKDRLTDLNVLQILYACVGVPYKRVVETDIWSLTFRDGWLEHYSRELCGCPEEEDAGYTTEDPDTQLREWEEDQRERRKERRRDEEGNDYVSSGDKYEGSLAGFWFLRRR